MNHPTSERILDHLRHAHPQTVSELARIFSLTPADVRYHLNHLMQAGMILRVYRKRGDAAGRPAFTYTARPIGQGQGSELLSEAFLQLIAPEDIKNTIHQLANILISRHSEFTYHTQSLQWGVEQLTTLGYCAQWEARPINPMLKLRCCPYLHLAVKFPLLCQMDLELIHQLTGWQAQPQVLIRTDPLQVPACIFSLSQ